MENKNLILIQDQMLVIDDDQRWLHSSDSPLGFDELPIVERLEVQETNGQTFQVAELEQHVDQKYLISYRHLMATVNSAQGAIISRALQLLTWKKQHQYCGQCGQKTAAHKDDLARVCHACQLSYYPRISPCIMCLIVRGEYCLLANHQRHPDGLYSTLAGFVEAGENLEQTLKREVKEEVGVTVSSLDYFSSQSWPFPHQLMMGFFALYESGEIEIDQQEIHKAQWFHYENLPKIPPSTTLSGQLITAFVERCNKQSAE